MATQELIDRLAEHRTLGKAPREELVWLAEHGQIRRLEAGQVLSHKNEPVQGLFVILAGRLGMTVDRGAGPHKIADWRGGDVTGVLPYSRLVSPPGDSVAEEPTEVLYIPREEIRDLILACHEITSILVHNMLDRTRSFTSNELHDEKMVSLGKMSAGLAHELNNPASAIERGAALLGKRLEEAQQAARALGKSRLSDAQLAAVDDVRHACVAAPHQGVRSPVQQAEREEAIGDWLADHGLDTGLADELADSAVGIEALEGLAKMVDAAALGAALRGVASGCAIRGLASEIQDAAQRITGLVRAIKGFTHMDQAAVAGPVDLAQELSDTVTVLRSKARGKAIAVDVKVEPGLPRALGFAGELNQIWMNLIDNALDAAPQGGHVEVLANRDGKHAAVRVIDNGAGIPEAIRARIFDPFFTTKPVGSGVGLGLDIVRRLLIHNNGQIAVTSQPGRTEFKVILPLDEVEGGQGKA